MIPVTLRHDLSKEPIGFIETKSDRLIVRMNYPIPKDIIFSIFGNIACIVTECCEIGGEVYYVGFEILSFSYSPKEPIAAKPLVKEN